MQEIFGLLEHEQAKIILDMYPKLSRPSWTDLIEYAHRCAGNNTQGLFYLGDHIFHVNVILTPDKIEFVCHSKDQLVISNSLQSPTLEDLCSKIGREFDIPVECVPIGDCFLYAGETLNGLKRSYTVSKIIELLEGLENEKGDKIIKEAVYSPRSEKPFQVFVTDPQSFSDPRISPDVFSIDKYSEPVPEYNKYDI